MVLAPLVVALLAFGGLALGNHGSHLDGLSDVADGLAASYDGERRSLAVMKHRHPPDPPAWSRWC